MQLSTANGDKSEESAEKQTGTPSYPDQLRRAALIGALYVLGVVIVQIVLLWNAKYVHATAWAFATSCIWRSLIAPRLPDTQRIGAY